jgi:hypothetical protein
MKWALTPPIDNPFAFADSSSFALRKLESADAPLRIMSCDSDALDDMAASYELINKNAIAYSSASTATTRSVGTSKPATSA